MSNESAVTVRRSWIGAARCAPRRLLNRFAVSSSPFKTHADGSLDLCRHNERPGEDKEANWLPAPMGR